MTEYDISDFPLILLIDCHQVDETAIAIVHKDNIEIYKKSLRAQQLPEIIADFLSSLGLDIKAIKALGIIDKEGSLTGMRVGVTVANVLAWNDDLPVFTIDSDSIDDAASAIRQGTSFHLKKKLSTN